MKTDIFEETMFAEASTLDKVDTQTGKQLSNLVIKLNDV